MSFTDACPGCSTIHFPATARPYKNPASFSISRLNLFSCTSPIVLSQQSRIRISIDFWTRTLCSHFATPHIKSLHQAFIMSKAVEKVKEIIADLKGDKHNAGTTTGTAGTTTGTTGTAEGVHGPHSSRAANTLDPRVDSDRDGSATTGGNSGLTGTTGTHTGTHTGGGLTGTTGTTGTAQGVHGPHSSRIANTLDPRVDSDRDGSATTGGGLTGSTGTYGTHTAQPALA